MNRFVVLHHEVPPGATRGSHWDLMLEDGEVLATWALPAWPPVSACNVISLPAHRLKYLTYEGPLSEARGWVRQVACGSYQVHHRSPTRWEVTLIEDAIRRELTLQQESGDQWTLRLGLFDGSGSAPG